MYIVDKDVILISFDPVFQSIDGIAIRRNNAQLKSTYALLVYVIHFLTFKYSALLHSYNFCTLLQIYLCTIFLQTI